MDRTRRHVRSLLIALGVLAISAGLVAGREMPAAADHGLSTAGEAAGKVVPVGPPADEAATPAEETELDETVEEADADRPENHGRYVSEAAKGDTPDEYRNHGEYVSSIAKGDAGKPEAAANGQAKADDAPGRAVAAEAKNTSRGGGSD